MPSQHVWNLFKLLIRMFTVAVSTKVQCGWNNRTLAACKAKCCKFMSQILYVIMQLMLYFQQNPVWATDNHPDRGIYFFLSNSLQQHLGIIWSSGRYKFSLLGAGGGQEWLTIDQLKNITKANSLPKRVTTTSQVEVQHTEQQHCWAMINFWNVKNCCPKK